MPLATMSIRVEEETKRGIEAFCSEVGMNPSTAVNLFFKAVLRENRLPFELMRDPFYSEANMRHLRESVAQMDAGKTARHELIPCDD